MVVALTWVLGLAVQPGAAARPSPGERSAPAGIDWQVPVVLLFHSVECPISDRYVPEIKRLHGKYGVPAGISFYLVFPNRGESDAVVEEYLAERALALPVLRDRDAALTRRVGAQVTPEAVVLLPGSSGPELVYRGRYDDRYTELGRSRPRAGVHFLDEVLASVAAGRRPLFSDTGAVGCYIVSEGLSPSASAAKDSRARESHRHDTHGH